MLMRSSYLIEWAFVLPPLHPAVLGTEAGVSGLSNLFDGEHAGAVDMRGEDQGGVEELL